MVYIHKIFFMTDQCPHHNVAIDKVADMVICRDCGLVMMDRPSICEPRDTLMERDPSLSIPRATRCRVFDMASTLNVSMHHVLSACRHIRDMHATMRHPATLAACLLETPGVSIPLKEASSKLDISVRSLRRAVSRLRREKIKY